MRHLPLRTAIAAALAVLVASACSGRLGAPEPLSDRAAAVVDLWRLFMLASIVVGGIVIGLIVWSAVRYRAGRGREAATFREHVPIEIAYTAIPVVIVAGLFLATFQTERTVENLEAEPDVTVDVTGFIWSWSFAYAGTDVVIEGVPSAPPTLVLPRGRLVRIVLRSSDVIHAFYVPELLFKRDAIPGRTTEFQFVAERLGTFHGQCAEFCGLDHARMTFHVQVVPPAEFDEWLAAQTEAAP